MHRNVIFASAMDVEVVTKVFLRHGRAFDVPAWKADAPWGGPLHLAFFAGRREFPQCKIGRTLFFSKIDALAGLEPCPVQPGEIAVVRLPARVRSASRARTIRAAARCGSGDELELCAHSVARAAGDRRP